MALPQPNEDPLAIDFSADPVLAIADQAADPDAFRSIVLSAITQNAGRREAEASIDIAKAELDEAEAGYLPTVDLSLNSYRTLAREFGDDPFNLLESSRPRKRTDATGVVEWVLFDWGTVQGSIMAAQQRLEAEGHARDATLIELISRVVIGWYAVSAYQNLERFAQAYNESLDVMSSALEKRIELGVSAPSDRTRMASLEAEGAIQLARLTQQRASAEARLGELTGLAMIPNLQRPPYIGEIGLSRELVIAASGHAPEVLAAEARARAARLDARTAVSSQAPRMSARVEGGRYGVLENEPDYDVRAALVLRYRLFGGGGKARINQAQARADKANATADRIRQEIERDTAVAWADVQALQIQLAALGDSYKAARRNRDVVVRRFAALRGSLFDVTDAQEQYLSAAIAYIEGLTQLDAARYTLLARTGRILNLFMPNDMGQQR
jgi:adhesin transport system outer membrane protein